MRDLTFLDLAAILQLDESLKETLSKNFNNYSDGLKYDILSILWDGVYELKKKLAQLKYEQYLNEIDEGKRELTTDLYDQAVKAVWEDLDKIISGENKNEAVIESIRNELKSTVSSQLNDVKQDKPSE